MGIATIPPLPPPSGTSLSGSDFNQTARLNQVFEQLLVVLQVLQAVAISQSQNLNFLTAWQEAYTNLMSQVPVFLASSTPFGGTKSGPVNTRQEVNTLNSTYLEQLRSENTIISDNAKAMQSNISQTNDEVTQFGNMAASFLEELNTILSTITRSSGS